MNIKHLILAAAFLTVTPFLNGQTTSTSKTVTAEVVAVHGQKLIYKQDGKILEAEIPPTVRFDVGGKQLTLAELEPGSTVTATITTKTTEIPGEKIVTVKNAEVMHVNGRTVVLKHENGEFKKHSVPGDFPIMADGKKTTVYKLKKGMKISATFTEQKPATLVTEKEMTAMATLPEKPEPAPEPAQAAPATKLPKTGSHVALLGVFGLMSLGAGLGLRRLRRRS